jgi:hypothetical protein
MQRGAEALLQSRLERPMLAGRDRRVHGVRPGWYRHGRGGRGLTALALDDGDGQGARPSGGVRHCGRERRRGLLHCAMAVDIPLYSADCGRGRDLHTQGDWDADDGGSPEGRRGRDARDRRGLHRQGLDHHSTHAYAPGLTAIERRGESIQYGPCDLIKNREAASGIRDQKRRMVRIEQGWRIGGTHGDVRQGL